MSETISLSDESSSLEMLSDFSFEYQFAHTEFLYSRDNNYSYTVCIMPYTFPGFNFAEECAYPKCDVYTVHSLRSMNASVLFDKLQSDIKKIGSDVYAVRVDTTDDYSCMISSRMPLDKMMAWTSKEAYDKWHLVNDQILQDNVISDQIFNIFPFSNGKVHSHLHLVYRFDSILLEQHELYKYNHECRNVRFDIAGTRHEIHNSECRVVRFDIAGKRILIIPKTKIRFKTIETNLLDVQGFMNDSVEHRPHRILYIFQP